MPTVSLCMIVKNEEETLARCIASVADIVDEIVIVDTGSEDGTREIARQFTQKVFEFTWVDDFAAARNASFEKATMEYIFWMDADDVLLDGDRAKFLALKNSLDSKVDTVMMKYNIEFDQKGEPVFSYYRERLIKRACNFKWAEPVHEYIRFGGTVINSDICVTHKKIGNATPGRNLAIYEKYMAQGKELSTRGLYYYARELKDAGRLAEAEEKFRLFLESKMGWVEDNIRACMELAQCLKGRGENEKALECLFGAFSFDVPRPETCCMVGYVFEELAKYREAAFWFELAAGMKKPVEGWGFEHPRYADFIPFMELAVCYDRMGDYDRAEEYNEKAGRVYPDFSGYLQNKSYFAAIKKAIGTE